MDSPGVGAPGGSVESVMLTDNSMTIEEQRACAQRFFDVARCFGS